jgi:hypothetical protein
MLSAAVLSDRSHNQELPMPKNKVSDLITDQEMAFARLVLSGGMTDRHAAEAVGLNPDSAAYIKSKPSVRDYMLDHRAAVQQQLVQQEAEGLHRLNLDRQQVLNRLWELASLSPEMTRGSITGQVKALSMIVAMENFIPDRRALDRLALSSEKKSAPAPIPQIHAAACLSRPSRPAVELARHQARTFNPPLSPAPPIQAPPNPGPSQSTFVHPFSLSQPQPLASYIPGATYVPDLRVPFSIKENPFTRPR